LIVANTNASFNIEVFPTKDWRVRKAFNLMVNHEDLHLFGTDGYGCLVIILGCKPSWFLGEKDFAGQLGILSKDRAKDLAQAKDLLKQAGVDPAATTIILGTGAASVARSSILYEQSLAYRDGLVALGFKVDFRSGAGHSGLTQQKSREAGYPINMETRGGIGGLVLDYALWDGFHSSANYNAALWNDLKTDQMTEEQQSTLDTAKRKQQLQDIQRYLLADGQIPVGLVVRNFDWIATQPKVRDWKGTAYFLSRYTWQFAWVWLEK
jgi:ABC-type transport system substrate-binding protein